MNIRIKKARQLHGLTQRQLGERIGRTASYISKVEAGVIESADPGMLSGALGVREGWLRDGSGPMTENEEKRDRRTIGERIMQLRKEKKMTQAAFAEKLSVSRNTVSLLERNKISASPAIIKKVVEKTGTDETWLRTGEIESRAEEIKLWLSTHPADLEEIKMWIDNGTHG